MTLHLAECPPDCKTEHGLTVRLARARRMAWTVAQILAEDANRELERRLQARQRGEES